MSGTVFRAHDSAQVEALVSHLGRALDLPAEVKYVAHASFEGDETSLFLWSFFQRGYVMGWRGGKDAGRDGAYDYVFARRPKPRRDTAKHVASRAKARHRKRSKR